MALRAFNFSRNLSTSVVVRMCKPRQMQQVEVDEAHVKEQLGNLQMTFVKKAEKLNKERAERHVLHRKKHAFVGLTCLAVIIGIYSYTIYAVKQETFLNDFEMPDPLEEEERRL